MCQRGVSGKRCVREVCQVRGVSGKRCVREVCQVRKECLMGGVCQM